MILNLSAYANPHSVAVTIGSFDGLHRGHLAVLDALAKKATDESVQSVVLTFVEPPQNYLGHKKELILPSLKKLKLLEQHADFVVVANFMEMAKMTPGDFFEEIVMKRMNATALVVGENFRFGVDHAGDAKMLERMAKRHGIDVTVVPLVKSGGYEVSSTRIRELLRDGKHGEADELMASVHWEGHGRINKTETKG